MKTGNSCQKRAFLTLFGGMVIFCLCGFHSCNMETELYGSSLVQLTKRLENGCYRYDFHKTMVLAHPLRCRLVSRYDISKKYAGCMVWNGFEREIDHNLLGGEEYLELPVGTKMIFTSFFVDKPEGFGDFGNQSSEEYYFLEVMLPDKPEWDYNFVYFLGYDHKIVPGFWQIAGKLLEMEAFAPVDIEKIFPHGFWW